MIRTSLFQSSCFYKGKETKKVTEEDDKLIDDGLRKSDILLCESCETIFYKVRVFCESCSENTRTFGRE